MTVVLRQVFWLMAFPLGAPSHDLFAVALAPSQPLTAAGLLRIFTGFLAMKRCSLLHYYVTGSGGKSQLFYDGIPWEIPRWQGQIVDALRRAGTPHPPQAAPFPSGERHMDLPKPSPAAPARQRGEGGPSKTADKVEYSALPRPCIDGSPKCTYNLPISNISGARE